MLLANHIACRRITVAGICLGSLIGSAAMAQQPAPYRDDRSAPAALVQSLYNAVSRKEYARAWSYFGVPPAADIAAYTAGYADTANVTVVTGLPAEEGAAGSTIYTLPVALLATDTAGTEKVFSGCYTLKLANPQIQGDSYQPLHIEKATLSPSTEAFDKALPTTCPDAPALPAYDAMLERAKAEFAASRADDCVQGIEEGAAPESFDISFHFSSDAESEPERTARLFRFFCSRGAYNETHAYLLVDDIGELREMQFAVPELDIHYVGGNEEKVEAVNVKGFNTLTGLVNSDYDAKTRTLTSWSKWRGVGDASSIGTWIFRDGDFALVQFDVDASYDGEVEHQTVVNYNEAP